MENMEKNEIITTEAIENITEADSNGGSVLKTIGIIGLGVAGAALLTKFVLIPAGRRIIKAVHRKKRVTMTVAEPEADEVELDDIDLDDIPDIDE